MEAETPSGPIQNELIDLDSKAFKNFKVTMLTEVQEIVTRTKDSLTDMFN